MRDWEEVVLAINDAQNPGVEGDALDYLSGSQVVREWYMSLPDTDKCLLAYDAADACESDLREAVAKPWKWMAEMYCLANMVTPMEAWHQIASMSVEPEQIETGGGMRDVIESLEAAEEN